MRRLRADRSSTMVVHAVCCVWVFGMSLLCAQEKSVQRTASHASASSAEAWSDLAKLPDWSGTWSPAVRLQNEEITKNPTPWNAKIAAQIEKMTAEEKAGRSRGGLFVNC